MATAGPSDATMLSDLGFLRRLAWSLTRNEASADDLAQDATLIALERRPADLRAPRAWLRRVLGNLAINAHRTDGRRRQHESAVPERAPVLSPEQHAARREMLEAVVAEVLRLEEPFGTAVIMRFYDDLPPNEIARRLGVPEGTVRSRLSRGLAILRARLDSRVGPRERWATLLAPAALLRGGALGAGAKAAVAALLLVAVLAPLTITWLRSGQVERRSQSSEIARTAATDRGASLAAAPGPASDPLVVPGDPPSTVVEAPAAPVQDAASGGGDPEPAPIRGVALDAETQAPVAGTEIAWVLHEALAPELRARLAFWEESAEREAMARARRVTTGADGAFEIPGTPARMLVIARAGDRWGMLKGALSAAVTIRMAVDRSDWIEVADRDGHSRAGVPVSIKRLGGPVPFVAWRGVTGGDGKAEIRHAQQLRPEGRRVGLAYGVDVFGSKPVEDSTTSGVARVRLELPATAALKVLVKNPDQTPFGAGAEVTIRAPRASSDADAAGLKAVTDGFGWSTFPFLAPGTEMTVAAADPAGRFRAAAEVPVATPDPGGSVDLVVAFMERARTVVVRARDASGRPLSNRAIRRADMPSSDGSEPAAFATDAEGQVRIPVAGEASIELLASDDRGVPALGAHVAVPAAAGLGDAAAVEATFRLLPVVAAGRVRAADASSAAGVTLVAERGAKASDVPFPTSPEPELVARTASDGRFVMRGFQRGSRLRIKTLGGGLSNNGVVCDEGASDVEVAFARPSEGRRVAGIRGSIIVDREVPLERLRAALARRPEPGSPVRFGPTEVPLRELPGAGAGERRAEFAFPGLEPSGYDFTIQSVGGSDPVTITRIENATTSTSFGSFGSFEGGVPVFEGPRIEVAAGSPADSRLQDIDLRGRLRVVKTRAVDRDGKPVAGAEATVLTSESPARKVGGGTSDADGRIVVVTSPGPHRLVVRAAGFRTASQAIADAPAAVELRRGIPVRVVVRASPDKVPPQGLWVRVEWTSNPASRAPDTSDEAVAIARLPDDGRVRLVDLSGTLLVPVAGSYRVMITSDAGPQGQGAFVTHSARATDVIDVKDADAEQTFEVALGAR